MASKKITTAPSGASFTHTPAQPYGALMHTWPLDPHHDCGGTIVMSEGELPTVSGGAVFICTGCDWISPDGYRHTPTKPQKRPQPKPMKKQRAVVDPPELRAAVNAEVRRQMARLAKERVKFPPSLIPERVKAVRGPDKGKIITVWHDNPDFTGAMRDHMHTFAVDAQAIRDELKAKGV